MSEKLILIVLIITIFSSLALGIFSDFLAFDNLIQENRLSGLRLLNESVKIPRLISLFEEELLKLKEAFSLLELKYAELVFQLITFSTSEIESELLEILENHRSELDAIYVSQLNALGSSLNKLVDIENKLREKNEDLQIERKLLQEKELEDSELLAEHYSLEQELNHINEESPLVIFFLVQEIERGIYLCKEFFTELNFVYKSHLHTPSSNKLSSLRLAYQSNEQFRDNQGRIFAYDVYTDAKDPNGIDARVKEIKERQEQIAQFKTVLEHQESIVENLERAVVSLEGKKKKESENFRQIVTESYYAFSERYKEDIDKLTQVLISISKQQAVIIFDSILSPFVAANYATFLTSVRSNDPIEFSNEMLARLFTISQLCYRAELVEVDLLKSEAVIKFIDLLSNRERDLMTTFQKRLEERAFARSRSFQLERLVFNKWKEPLSLGETLVNNSYSVGILSSKDWDSYRITNEMLADIEVVFDLQHLSSSDVSHVGIQEEYFANLNDWSNNADEQISYATATNNDDPTRHITPPVMDFQAQIRGVPRLNTPFEIRLYFPETLPSTSKITLVISGSGKAETKFDVSQKEESVTIIPGNFGEYYVNIRLTSGEATLTKELKFEVSSVSNIEFVESETSYISKYQLSAFRFSKIPLETTYRGLKFILKNGEDLTYLGSIFAINLLAEEIGLPSAYDENFARVTNGVSLLMLEQVAFIKEEANQFENTDNAEFLEGYYDYKGRKVEQTRLANLEASKKKTTSKLFAQSINLLDCGIDLLEINTLSPGVASFRVVIPKVVLKDTLTLYLN
ncbi:MAG: hypothetical protein KA938_05305 [Fervidobacterium sp.]|nr:hypothetical protein [Fervidobacterium sp.]